MASKNPMVLKARRRVTNRALYRRRKRRAKNIRDVLRIAMGNHCSACGCVYPLEFDHPKGRTWEPNRLNCFERAMKYLEDWAAGRLRLLCCACNKRDGARRRWAACQKQPNVSPDT